ncbi:hypothetical protein ACJMK2_005208 [Sinanodonta woodiana]|uniref:SCP domain-containing protein n=1 Tax=Sinanodonta woodiana TaxID=1069815 RepID=A0ABD3VPG3_SINWO
MAGRILLALMLMLIFQVAVTQVTEADKTLIASVHDEYRFSVQSSNMMKMRYHDGLADKAQIHANKCIYKHDTEAERASPELLGINVGQNIAYYTGGKNWKYIISLWASEMQNFKLDVGSTNGSAVGHYTQLMLWKTQAVGCGYNECVGFKFYVCNYAYGQYSWDLNYPWKAGAKCADCPSNCNNGFCDCKMQFCGSKTDIKDAKCSCTPWWLLKWWE